MNKKFGTSKKPTSRKVSDLMLRIPALRQLNSSQALVLKLTPVWLNCLDEAKSLGKISTQSITGTKIRSVNNNTLLVQCSNAVIASQLKQSQQYIIDSIGKNDFIEIKEIKFIIEPATVTKHLGNKIADQQTREKAGQYVANQNRQQKPSSDSLRAIENCQKLVDDESLAKSLAKLANTLKTL